MGRTHLKRIIESAISPHPSHIVMSHVAVIQELTGEMLATTATTFRLKIQRF